MLIDAFARVVAKYGFSESLEGVMESVRVMSTLARDDEQLVQRLVKIRRALTPTGTWIREDADADAEDQRKRQLELDAVRQQQEDAQRAERLAAENARKAKLRARKIALGLDPSVERLPELVEEPPAHFVTLANKSVHLRVNAHFTRSFQWHADGVSISDEQDETTLVTGVHWSTLVLKKLTKRVVGEYFCVCENEEGARVTRSCRVAVVALSARRLLSRKLKGLATAPFTVLCWKRAAVCCVANAVVLFDWSTFAPVKVLPALPNGEHQTLAWASQTKLLVTASCAKNRKNEVSVYSLDFTTVENEAVVTATSTSEHRKSVTSSLKPKSKAATAASSVGGSAISHLLSTHRVNELSAIHLAQFFATGKLLLLSDMKRSVAVCTLVPSFTCQQLLAFDSSDRICHVASCAHESAFAVAFRNKAFLRLYSSSQQAEATISNTNKRPSFECHQLTFKSPVNCAAFDARGFFLAVAEFSCLKAWISVVNVHTKRPSKTRFEAHVGKVSCLQWTKVTSLLLSSGFDGYVKLWDVEARACLLSVHLDDRGVHTFTLVDDDHEDESSDVVLLAFGYTECRLQSRTIVQLRAFEATRRLELNAHAATIQKRWKGLQTRELIKKFVKTTKGAA